MELQIGTKLAQLRREKGLTQDQLAEKLGVSAPAVSKWETGHSYPDITLLCPLARALGTSVDSLLRFEENLSDREAVEIMNDILELARNDGYEPAEQKMTDLLHKYPNSVSLKFHAAVVWNTFPVLFPDADETTRLQWNSHKKSLLTEVRSSQDSAYRQTAALQLAQIAISEGDLEYGEQLLNELPEQTVDPTVARVQLCLKKDAPEEALKITQKRLFSLVQQVQACLMLMMNSKMIKDDEQILKIFKVYRDMDELFGLGNLYDGLLLTIYLDMQRYEEAADCLVRYANAVTGEAVTPKRFLFEPGLKIKSHMPAVSKELRQMLLKGLEEEPAAALLHDPRCRTALEKIRSSL